VSDHITTLAELICADVPSERHPGTGDDLQLFRLYAVLARVKGTSITAEDVHDAWCAWAAERDPGHAALVPFADLDPAAKAVDEYYAQAIIESATR
jgi:hypothetical protein